MDLSDKISVGVHFKSGVSYESGKRFLEEELGYKVTGRLYGGGLGDLWLFIEIPTSERDSAYRRLKAYYPTIIGLNENIF